MDGDVAAEGRRGRRGRDARRAGRAEADRAPATPYIARKVPLTEVLSAEGLALIEANAETILAEIGVDFRDDAEAIRLWREAGAEVQGERVRLPRGLARHLLKTAPAHFTQHARNPARSVEIGGDNTVFAPVYGPPFVRDLEGGRRYGTIEDFRNFVKLAYVSPHLHHSGGTVCEPVDLPVNKRHLDMVYSHIRYSDKPFMGSVTAASRAADSVRMAELVFGADVVAANTVLVNLINCNSPLVLDGTMLGALRIYAATNQACIVSPFILAGAMSPVTAAGTLAQLLAEAMAGMAFTQLVRPGAPVVFGTFVSAVSMQSGAPTFGSPEGAQMLVAAAQLARRLGVPFRSGGSLTASKMPDAQAAYESANTLQPTVQAGVNFVLHACGWLEGGLCAGYEKFVMDADQLGMAAVYARGIDLGEAAQALDAIREVGPGSHYLGATHTREHFETAFYRSALADNNSVEQWEADGSHDMAARAHALWKRQLAAYEAPPLDPGIDEALQSFMAERKAAEPDSNV